MESDSQAKERQLAITIVEATSPSDRELLQQWITQLLVLKDAPLGKLEKAKKAIAVTASSKAAVTAAKIVTKHIKRVAWDERSTPPVSAWAGLHWALPPLVPRVQVWQH